MVTYTSAEKERLINEIKEGIAPRAVRFEGDLDLRKQTISLPPSPDSFRLPDELIVRNLTLAGQSSLTSLPTRLRAHRLDISNTSVRELPPGLECRELIARGSLLETIPSSLRVRYRLDLQGAQRLTHLPEGLAVGVLNLRGCTALEALPEGLRVSFLDISECTGLTRFPEQATVSHGNFLAAGCRQLSRLPAWLKQVAQLNLRDWVELRELPTHLTVTSSLDLGGTAVTSLPEGVRKARLLWRGVQIDELVLSRPETITAEAVMDERNVERRRVLLERMGYDRFLREAETELLDTDQDPGGQRQLIRVPLEEDEPLVCLAVTCPSTGRQYMLRVPPRTRTCREAAAWIAGFDDPDAYQPLVES